ncbi:DNA polymerase III subunit delta' [Agaricicola taiwanensis]|uniref:DNA polymerase III subunit delta n=1 Tax=Agaricicola taiwanensis TaxID=591372 RepID=A0A8J2YIN7_9RHOB|nr:DNA polymerase III subunit delta' [Agaricicola taiwanensis]GGE45731.1 DNA polymerase III subunit delta' [Agaricicola taiwanensis]
MAETPDDLPEPDRLEGVLHPREMGHLFGQEKAEQELLGAYRRGQMHHAWILGGPLGIGKATLAYRLARFVLAHPDPAVPEVQSATSLAVVGDHPAARQIARMAHPDLLVLRRGWVPERKTVSGEIRVADVRRVGAFFGATAGQGGWRVCIVDSADDLNINSANALLKNLEEPPARALFILVSSAPRRLLPTIRSRCRTLILPPVSPEAIARVGETLAGMGADIDINAVRSAASMAEGSVRRALELASGENHELRAAAQSLLGAWPDIDRRAVHELGDMVLRGGSDAFDVVAEQVLDWLHAQAGGRARSGSRALGVWTDHWERTTRMARDARTFNLDGKGLVIKMFSELSALR